MEPEARCAEIEGRLESAQTAVTVAYIAHWGRAPSAEVIASVFWSSTYGDVVISGESGLSLYSHAMWRRIDAELQARGLWREDINCAITRVVRS
jgi:hypothetical protein